MKIIPFSSSRMSSLFAMKNSSMAILLVLIFALVFAPFKALSQSTGKFSPKDNILIDCGGSSSNKGPDGREFKSDKDTSQYLKTNKDVQVSDDSAKVNGLYKTARIFHEESTYAFTMTHPGWHWLRLHFFPVKTDEFDLSSAVFSVSTDKVVLLHNFKDSNASEPVMKEYMINVTDPQLSIKFTPMKNSAAFVNAIEVVSAPDKLIVDSGTSLDPINDYTGLTNYAYQYVYRVNMGGPLISGSNDTLGRIWIPDKSFLKDEALSTPVTVGTNAIKYSDTENSPLVGPPTLYASAATMGDAQTTQATFNVTWNFEVDSAFSYVLRMHFCDIVSKALNDLYFNVYVNGKTAFSGLDLSSLTNRLATPYYHDIVVNASLMSSGLTVQIGPFNQGTGTRNALLNGLEVLKMSNSVDSLDGEFGVDGQQASSSNRGTVAAVGFAMMFGAFVGLGAMVIKWHKRPQDWEKRNSFSSWLLPLHTGDNSFLSSKSGSQKSGAFNSTGGLGRYFSFIELQEATKNFDSEAIVGVGGFGNVYLGAIDDGTQVAVKRGNPQSEQGITEFQTEIQMLSKLRHRHLVSLIGYCDENSEMILVYEYMSNGPFRDHLYGKNLPALSWKQRLEICIGAARGLHYLHTGTAQGIIHRDVKTTNILLDDNFVAKVADFGLSKDAPMGQGHVSTAVKGSFGYLDPEYFRRQQLTDKSDVYSFGVVLLEAVCVRPAINPQLPREQVNLAEWAMQCKRKGQIEKIIDPLLIGTINPESLKKFAEAAEKCLAEHGVDRPTMGDVLWNLEYALQLQESFTNEKSEDETKSTPAAPLTLPPDSDSDSDDEKKPEHPPQTQPLPVDDNSNTQMFTQFTDLNGR